MPKRADPLPLPPWPMPSQPDAGTLVSIDRVKEEVLSGGKGDALEEWAKKYRRVWPKPIAADF